MTLKDQLKKAIETAQCAVDLCQTEVSKARSMEIKSCADAQAAREVSQGLEKALHEARANATLIAGERAAAEQALGIVSKKYAELEKTVVDLRRRIDLDNNNMAQLSEDLVHARAKVAELDASMHEALAGREALAVDCYALKDELATQRARELKLLAAGSLLDAKYGKLKAFLAKFKWIPFIRKLLEEVK
jgi:chromosome segregation ATPase